MSRKGREENQDQGSSKGRRKHVWREVTKEGVIQVGALSGRREANGARRVRATNIRKGCVRCASRVIKFRGRYVRKHFQSSLSVQMGGLVALALRGLAFDCCCF